MNAASIGLLTGSALVALAFRPWSALRTLALRDPWVAVLVLLPCLWAAQVALPASLPLQLSGSCLLVLMFGWPLAVLTLLPIALAGAWNGVIPATAARAMGVAAALRAWSMPQQPGSGGATLVAAAWLIAWGEAFATGALTAIFVAFRPQWLLTYSDARYLPTTAG